MKVAFFQPRHFNRTERKTNPFFDPIIDVCREAGIPYRIYQPYRRPDTGYPAVCSSQMLRKFVRFVKWLFGFFMRGRSDADLELLAGRLWNVLTCGTWRADTYITIAAEFANVLPGLNPRARIVDVQHGIIYPGHFGYLDRNGALLPHLSRFRQREFWLCGEGFAREFFRNAANAEVLDGRVHVIGDPRTLIEASSVFEHGHSANSVVLLALQLTSECSLEENRDMFKKTCRFLRMAQARGLLRGELILRHHPRYNRCYDIDELLAICPQARLTEESLDQLACRVDVMVTLDSTAAFDVAKYGVPTYFIGSDGEDPECRTPCADIWQTVFHYPYWGMPFEQVLKRLRDEGSVMRRRMQDWYRSFYSPFDADAVRQLLVGAADPVACSSERRGL